jgi:type I restriction enzyme M protein
VTATVADAGADPNPVAIGQTELEARLWDAANALRGPVDSADLKNYVFPLLFWKWISDSRWKEKGKPSDDRLRISNEATWERVTESKTNLGTRIGQALAQIESLNDSRTRGIFGDVTWSNSDRLPDARLGRFVDALSAISLAPEHVDSDLLGRAYEYLLLQFADVSGRKAGEFFTPPNVARLIVDLLEPSPHETIYDPACGSGGMLVEALRAVREETASEATPTIFGQEVNLTTSAIARMNLLVHGAYGASIARGDTLRHPIHLTDGRPSTFDVVIANPPFSLQNWGAESWASDYRNAFGTPPSKNGDFAWVQHMVASMDQCSGRAGIILPRGVLFRRGSEGTIRRRLVEADLVEAVIALPENMFYSTSIPACIWVLRKVKDRDRVGRIQFVDASSAAVRQKRQNVISPVAAKAIVAAYKGLGSPVPHRSVTVETVANENYDLSVGKYLHDALGDAGSLPSAVDEYRATRLARLRAESHLDALLRSFRGER